MPSPVSILKTHTTSLKALDLHSPKPLSVPLSALYSRSSTMATSSSLRTVIAKSRSLLSATNPAASFATTAAAGAAKPKPSPKKPVAPKKPASASASASSGEKPARGILKPVPVSAQLGRFLGAEEASRTFAVKKVWEHIKLNNLQDAKNKKLIHCDEKLKTIFDGKDSVEFLEVSRLLSQHFRKAVV